MNNSLITDAESYFDKLGQASWQQALYRSLTHWIGIQDADNVLDVGCTTGWCSFHFAARCDSVQGIETSAQFVKRAQENADKNKFDNVYFTAVDFEKLPFDSNRFSIVLAQNVLFRQPRPHVVLQELRRVTAPGGQLVIVNPTEDLTSAHALAYAQAHSFTTFETESFLAYAAVYAKVREAQIGREQEWIDVLPAHTVEEAYLMDGIARVVRIVKPTLDLR